MCCARVTVRARALGPHQAKGVREFTNAAAEYAHAAYRLEVRLCSLVARGCRSDVRAARPRQARDEFAAGARGATRDAVERRVGRMRAKQGRLLAKRDQRAEVIAARVKVGWRATVGVCVRLSRCVRDRIARAQVLGAKLAAESNPAKRLMTINELAVRRARRRAPGNARVTVPACVGACSCDCAY